MRDGCLEIAEWARSSGGLEYCDQDIFEAAGCHTPQEHTRTAAQRRCREGRVSNQIGIKSHRSILLYTRVKLARVKTQADEGDVDEEDEEQNSDSWAEEEEGVG